MSNITDTTRTWRTILGSIAAIAIVYFLALHFGGAQVKSNFHNWVYITGLIIFLAFFVGFAIWALRIGENEDGNSSRIRIIAVTVIIILWGLGWLAGGNERVAPGSPQMEDVR